MMARSGNDGGPGTSFFLASWCSYASDEKSERGGDGGFVVVVFFYAASLTKGWFPIQGWGWKE